MLIKYLLDKFFAFILIILSSPLFILISAAILIDDGWPIFFSQIRIGKDSREFRIYKFRTMVVDAEDKGKGLAFTKDEILITRTGVILRKWSLDEIPQIFNILFGHMSFVGPRPTLPYQIKKYTKFQRRRLEVKPGITGLAQIEGRNNLPWSERIILDIKYIDEWSIITDIKIFFKTIPVVLLQKNININQKINEIDDL